MARSRRCVLILGVLVVAPACGGGGGGTTTPTPPSTTLAPAPSPSPAGPPPTVKLLVDNKQGQAPLQVAFDAYGSTDATGGKTLTFSVSFEGEPLQPAGGCGFSHTYNSSGVSSFDTKVCATDSHGVQGCDTASITAFVPISVSVKQSTGCAGTVEATASVGNAFRAMGAVDRVVFEARTGDGPRMTKEGTKNGANQWSTGVWAVGFTVKTTVSATAFSGNVPGASASASRPGC